MTDETASKPTANAAVPSRQADPSRVKDAARDPRPLKRWLQSRFLSKRISGRNRHRRATSRDKSLLEQRQAGTLALELFYAESDPHSHLAVQALLPICQRYGLTPKLYGVEPPEGVHNPEPELLPVMARHDAEQIALAYGLLPRRPDELPLPFQPESGGDRRRRLGHYGSAMFYLCGEWYWGVDRLCHLEQRLRSLGLDTDPEAPFLFGRPAETVMPGAGKGLSLEWYGSLRSPYTAIGWPRVVKLCEQAGIELILKPVLPMVMRGAPVSRVKGLYIFDDTAREAAFYAQPFGPFYDPIGEPVRRAYRILPEVRAAGLEQPFFGAFLQAAFTQGINLATDRGLKRVLRAAGLPTDLVNIANSDRPLPDELEVNQAAMYDLPSWGVPTFRLVDEQGAEILHAFGQDRLWLIAQACS